MAPFQRLAQSSKFWVLAIVCVTFVVLVTVDKMPQDSAIHAITALVAVYMGAVAHEDAAAKKAGDS